MRTSLGFAAAVLTAVSVTACASTTPGTPTGVRTSSVSGLVSGQILAAPGCPGPERLGTPCPPRPAAGADVRIESQGRVIAETTSATDGRFQMRVTPGTYRIVATSTAPLRSTSSKDITVTATTPVEVTLTVDSGLR